MVTRAVYRPIVWLSKPPCLTTRWAEIMQMKCKLESGAEAVISTMFYSTHKPKAQQWFVTVGWRKQGGRQQTPTQRRMDGYKETDIKRTDIYILKKKKATSDGTAEKRRLMREQRKENEVDGDALHSIHHDAFKWLRVDLGADGTRINQI